MRTNVVLEESLIEEAMELTGLKTKKDVIHESLRALIRLKKRKSLLDLVGKIKFTKKYNYKKLR